MNPQQQRLLAQSNNLFVKSGRFISYKIGSMNGLSDKHREETAPAGELRQNSMCRRAILVQPPPNTGGICNWLRWG